jgi:hypothetical protein
MNRAILLAAALAVAAPAVPALARPHDGYAVRHGHWARGQVLPHQYRTSGYIVRDYHRYRLRPPPRGYYYVRQGDDVLLTAVASGLISAVLADAVSGGYSGRYYEEEVAYGGGRGGDSYGRRGYGRSYGGRGGPGGGDGGSSVVQHGGGQTIIQEGPNGRSYTRQGPGGQTIVTEGPNGRTITRQGPGGQEIIREGPDGGSYTRQGRGGQEIWTDRGY